MAVCVLVVRLCRNRRLAILQFHYDIASAVGRPGHDQGRVLYHVRQIAVQSLAEIYEAVAVGSGCWGPYGVFVRTDEHMAKMKAQHKCFAACIGKEYRICVKEIDAFQKNFDMKEPDDKPVGGLESTA